MLCKTIVQSDDLKSYLKLRSHCADVVRIQEGYLCLQIQHCRLKVGGVSSHIHKRGLLHHSPRDLSLCYPALQSLQSVKPQKLRFVSHQSWNKDFLPSPLKYPHLLTTPHTTAGMLTCTHHCAFFIPNQSFHLRQSPLHFPKLNQIT